MKKHITILAVSLICHALAAEDARQNFQSVDDLIAHVKQAYQEAVLYDTNGFIVEVTLLPDCSTDRNIHLLSQIKSIRNLRICNGGFNSTNAMSALAEYPNLTGLGLVCFGGRSHHLISELSCLTNLQSLKLSQNSYQTNDTTYLARMTNL